MTNGGFDYVGGSGTLDLETIPAATVVVTLGPVEPGIAVVVFDGEGSLLPVSKDLVSK